MDDRDLFINTQYGRYKYDPDFDVYRKVIDRPLTHKERFGWLYVTVALTLITYLIIEFK